MNTSLDHLPAHKRELITAIAKLLQDSAPVEMLILFGSYARGDWVEDPLTGYVSDVPGTIRYGPIWRGRPGRSQVGCP
jgi:hypothetical protein